MGNLTNGLSSPAQVCLWTSPRRGPAAQPCVRPRVSSGRSEETSRAIAIVREHIATWTPEAFAMAFDGPPSTQADPNSHIVEWEMRVVPASLTACPLELCFAVGCCPKPACIGFGFDSKQRLAERLSLTSKDSAFVFGVEPVTVTPDQIRAFLTAVYDGRVEARYFAAFGRMVGASGRLLEDVGVHHLRGLKVGRRYRYSRYAPA